METGLGTSLNGKRESLFRAGWKSLAKKFERVLRFCMWESCFLVKKTDFLVKNTDFPVKNPIFFSNKNNFLDVFTIKLRMSHTC